MQDVQIPLEQTLQKYFGYSTFRPQQKEVIEHILAGNDAVVLMPTGGGKSLCFQMPALVLDGLTLVISPLIALMKDQVQALRSNGVAAAFLNSSLSSIEEAEINADIQNGIIKLLYVSPERLFSGSFLSYVKTLNVKLVAIDEAHCCSSWGHHFRPEYSKLYIIKRHMPEVPVVALTATADKAVRSDIGELLGLDSPLFFISSFDRPNLSLAVLPGRKKWEQIRQIVSRYQDASGIIYCSSRKGTEGIAAKLQAAGFSANYYHAGLSADMRDSIQDEFIEGKTKIICATVAFGMGIDKSDVRFVIHHNMPKNLEGYYQEIGRAGRDGQPAETILFYSYSDVQTQLNFIQDVDNEQYRNIQLAKLERMREYAEAQVCRRKILLSYFSETPADGDCGNCDVCKNPPKYFDGTTLAQMALSAIHRCKEQVNMSLLVDVLKGSYSAGVREMGFDQVKTFGAGARTTQFAWLLYIQQFVQQGVMELDYKDKYRLKLTSLSQDILFKGKKVNLVDFETVKERQEEQKKVKLEKVKVTLEYDDGLYDHLRNLRNQFAEEIGKPSYVIFSNASLEDMSARMPANIREFLQVNGVGEHKARKYGEKFLRAIDEYTGRRPENDYRLPEASAAVRRAKTTTTRTAKMPAHIETWQLLDSGKSPEEIALIRGIKVGTIYGYLSRAMIEGYEIDVEKLLSEQEIEQVKTAMTDLPNAEGLKPIFEHLNGTIDYGKLRIAMAVLR